MRRVAMLALASLLALSLAAPRARAATFADSVGALLPEGRVTVEILTPDYSPRLQQLSIKLLTAAQKDPAWFQAYTRTHHSPLPWHPNLGLTRAEYSEYLMASRTASYRVRQRAFLTITRIPRSNAYRFAGWGLLQSIDGMVLDLGTNRARTKEFGMLPGLGIAEPTDPTVTLAWKWYAVWKAIHQVGDASRGGKAKIASLHIGPLGDTGMTGLYWTARRVNLGDGLADEFLLLRFPTAGDPVRAK